MLCELLATTGIHPVLLDIGASGDQYPENWTPIASSSIYVGFDPDSRELGSSSKSAFFQWHMINRAATATDNEEIQLYLTASPYCSSTLPPDAQALSNYIFANLFEVVDTVHAPAITIERALREHQIERIHWFKTDSQGTDLRLFNSLSDNLRQQVLAIDIEPGLIDAYTGEDLFVDAHKSLTQQGFWLSDLQVHGTVRLRRALLAQATGRDDIDYGEAGRVLKSSPGWVEARYMCTVEKLIQQQAPLEDFVVLWVFSVLGDQWGFALDVAQACHANHPQSPVSLQLVEHTLKHIKEAFHAAAVAPRPSLPARIMRRLRRDLQWLYQR